MEQALYTLGIDVGSTTSKCVVLKDGKEIVGKALVEAGTGTNGPEKVMKALYDTMEIQRSQIQYSVATGYGRQAEGIADSDMSELSCHAKGAQFLLKGVKTVIDIGGQDIKVLGIDNGMLVSFQMNDKCAAGTGRFLELMAKVLQVEVDELGEMGMKSRNPAQISSTCTVFAESEVISQLSKGTSVNDIAAGVHRSVSSKVTGLVHRVGLLEPVLMTGGVSKNRDVVRAIEEQLKCEIQTSELSQFAGAIGAAIYAYQKARKLK